MRNKDSYGFRLYIGLNSEICICSWRCGEPIGRYKYGSDVIFIILFWEKEGGV
jgi:hypothetical protein